MGISSSGDSGYIPYNIHRYTSIERCNSIKRYNFIEIRYIAKLVIQTVKYTNIQKY